MENLRAKVLTEEKWAAISQQAGLADRELTSLVG